MEAKTIVMKCVVCSERERERGRERESERERVRERERAREEGRIKVSDRPKWNGQGVTELSNEIH